jgi:hypothetical protein
MLPQATPAARGRSEWKMSPKSNKTRTAVADGAVTAAAVLLTACGLTAGLRLRRPTTPRRCEHAGTGPAHSETQSSACVGADVRQRLPLRGLWRLHDATGGWPDPDADVSAA